MPHRERKEMGNEITVDEATRLARDSANESRDLLDCTRSVVGLVTARIKEDSFPEYDGSNEEMRLTAAVSSVASSVTALEYLAKRLESGESRLEYQAERLPNGERGGTAGWLHIVPSLAEETLQRSRSLFRLACDHAREKGFNVYASPEEAEEAETS